MSVGTTPAVVIARLWLVFERFSHTDALTPTNTLAYSRQTHINHKYSKKTTPSSINLKTYIKF